MASSEHPSAVFYLTKMKLKAVWIEWKQQGPFSRTISECTIFFDATYFWKKNTTFQEHFYNIDVEYGQKLLLQE